MAASDSKKAGDELARLEALLQRDPKSPEFHRLADAYTRAGRFLDAVALCRDGIRYNPQIVEGYVSLGRALFGAGQLARAVQVLRRCLTLKDPGTETYRLLGEVLLWQGAPSEAVAVLEDAHSRGYSERTLDALLERARGAMDSQKTDVVSIPERLRGIGNVAVAGTIGDSGDLGLPLRPGDTTPGIDPVEQIELLKTPFSDVPPDRMKTVPRALLDGSPRPPEGKWTSIEDMWSRELDAHTQPFPDVDSDVGGPHAVRSKLDIKLAPLVDPATEGMPPLPSEDSGMQVLPSNADAAAFAATVLGETAPERPERSTAPGVTVPLPPLTDADVTPPPERGASSIPPAPPPQLPPSLDDSAGTAETWAAPPRPDEDGAMAAEWSAPTVPVPTVPSLEGEDEIATVDGRRRDPPDPDLDEEMEGPQELDSLPLPQASLVAARAASGQPVETDRRLLDALSISPTGAPDRRARDSLPAAPRRIAEVERPRRRGKRAGAGFWILVCLLLGAAGAAGVYGYLRFFAGDAGRKALAEAGRARLLDGAAEYMASANALAEAARRRDDGTLAAEADLMRGLAWLQYRTGEPPPPTSVFKTWPQALAQAAVALADNDPPRAVALLAGTPHDTANQALRLLLLAWGAWLEGRTGDAQDQIEQARRLAPELTGADLLEGIWRREGREAALAEAAFRRALGRSPQHEVAAAGLAAVLLWRDPKAAEVDQLLGRTYSTPIGKTWHRLLTVERQFVLGERAPIAELQPLLQAAPSSPSLLFHGVEVLIRAGQFLEAAPELRRLKKIRSEADPALLLLESELDMARGLESLAIKRLERPGSNAMRRMRAWALAFAGRIDEIGPLVNDDTDDAAQPLRLLVEGLKDRKPPAALVELSRGSPEPKLALALLLRARGDRKGAIAAARDLLAWPWLRPRAQVLEAGLQLEEGRLEAALGLLLEVERTTRDFPPAEELLGQIDLQLGNAPSALVRFRGARSAGRSSPELTLGLIKALALSAPAEAVAALENARGELDERQRRIAADYVKLAEGKAVSPQSPAAGELPFLCALGDLLARSGRAREAEKIYQRARSLEPGHPLPPLKLGLLAAARGKAEALAHFERVIERVRRKKHFPPALISEAHLGKARYYLATKDWTSATEQARAAIKIEAHRADAYRVLAEALLSARRYREGRQALEKLLDLEPSDLTGLFLFGTAAKADRARAQHALQRFLQLEPTGKRAAIAKRALKRNR